MRIALIIPTRNALKYFPAVLQSIKEQSIQPDTFIVIDTSSTDGTVELSKNAGAQVISIKPENFNHGGTRRMASELVEADILIFMTQDAILFNQKSLENLIQPFMIDPKIGCAYGRQVPHLDAKILEKHSRFFNYPKISLTKKKTDSKFLGIKTCFSSDSFAAYRRTALDSIGGIPENVIGSEDSYVAGKMLIQGWCVRYEASAIVYHSHDYSIMQEFRRYFDIGVFYGRETWIKQNFGSAGKEGFKFFYSELCLLIKHGEIVLILETPLRMTAKILGYRLGKIERMLPNYIKSRISMNPGYWK